MTAEASIDLNFILYRIVAREETYLLDQSA